jgi:phosphohistidine phosphatase
MEIYILRHGEAEMRETGQADSDRKLTVYGKRDLKAVLKVARKLGVAPQVILSSPLRRAQETAKIAAEILHSKHVVETKSLVPDASPELVWKEIGGLQKVDSILIAGHNPHLGSLMAMLLEAALMVDLKKGALVRITTPSRLGPPRGVLKWMITPRIAKMLAKSL